MFRDSSGAAAERKDEMERYARFEGVVGRGFVVNPVTEKELGY